MRRVLFPALGLLEGAIAVVLGFIGTELPGSDDIDRGFRGANRVADQAGAQVRIIRRQVQDLRRPELQQLAVRMQNQTQLITRTLRQQQVDFDTVRTLSDALGEMAVGLDGLVDALDPTSIRRLGDGLDETAAFIEEKVVPGAVRAKNLPKIGQEPPIVLADLKEMNRVAGSLRQARKGIDATVSRWPELKKALTHSSALLRTTRDQLDAAVENRHEYETAMKQSVVLAEYIAALLPLITEQFDNRLDEQEQALNELGESLQEVKNTLPSYERTTQRIMRSGRILAWLAAAVVGLHGCYLMLSFRIGRRYSV